MVRAFSLSLLLVTATACLSTQAADPVHPPNPDPSDGGRRDATDVDGATPDASSPDAAVPDAGPTPDGGIRMASFNTHRFFDTVCDSHQCGANDYEEQPSRAQFEAKADAIAAAIRSLGADAVCLQEIETQSCLDALKARLPEFPVAFLAETGSAASVDVAVLAKGELIEHRSHYRDPLYRPDGSPTSFSRDLLEMHLRESGKRVIFFCAHFKSQSGDDPGRRLAEAQRAHDVMVASATEHPEALVVLGGDLNDTPGSAPLEALLSDGQIERAGAEQPNDRVATYRYDGQLNALDHLLRDVFASGRYVAGSAHAVHDPNRFGFGGSDHAAIEADFILSP